MKSLTLNFFKKSIAVLLAFAFVSASFTTFSVNAYAAENTAETYAQDYTRWIISSDSVVGRTKEYRSGYFTTADFRNTLDHGMSFYIDCQTPNTTFNMTIYKSNGQSAVPYGSMASNNPMASANFYLEGNTTYYFVLKPSKSTAVYDFAYNIYYDELK